MTILTIFGASGDLVKKKTIPALFHLFINHKLPDGFFILGISRSVMTNPQWREHLFPFVENLFGQIPFFSEYWEQFKKILHYLPGNLEDPVLFQGLNRLFQQELQKHDLLHVIYYLALAPDLYPKVINQLEKSRLFHNSSFIQYRIVLEKPFGHDFASAEELNQMIHRIFQENQIFRIDHFLGKETVNNIFVLRFANTVLEPVWNRNYIESVEITAGESVLVESRGAFYDQTGILRDMFQNHLLQLLAIIAMEPPAIFDSKSVRDEKVKVLRTVRRLRPLEVPDNIIFGQYAGYLEEKGVDPKSKTATFAAVKLFIDNWRWKDIPFYLRSGKGMSCRSTQIVIQFKKPPHLIFENGEFDIPLADRNRLLIQLQPAEGIKLSFLSKVPGPDMILKRSELTCSFETTSPKNRTTKETDAYARLLLDVISGNPFLFLRNDEISNAWQIIDPLQNYKDAPDTPDPAVYEKGNWGPNLGRPFDHHWFDLCPVISPES